MPGRMQELHVRPALGVDLAEGDQALDPAVGVDRDETAGGLREAALDGVAQRLRKRRLPQGYPRIVRCS